MGENKISGISAKFRQGNSRADWVALKAEFMRGDYRTVADFLISLGFAVDNGNCRKKTRGWGKEKSSLIAESANAKIQGAIESYAEKHTEDVRNVIETQRAISDLTMKRIFDKLTSNTKLYVDREGGEHTSELEAQDLLQLANAQKAAGELQRVTRGITHGGPDQSGDRDSALIGGRVLASIRRIAGRAGTKAVGPGSGEA